MTYAMLTAYTDNIKEWADIGCANKSAYCRKWNIPLIVDDLVPPDGMCWGKLLIVARHLVKFDWLFWTDADSLIMNSNLEFKPPTCEEDFVLSYDRNTLNAGQFWIRNCSWSFDFLMRAYCQRHGNWFTEDNGAIMYLLENNHLDMSHTKVVSQRLFNSYPHNGTYHDGDFMIHFAGPYDKKRLMSEWAAKAR